MKNKKKSNSSINIVNVGITILAILIFISYAISNLNSDNDETENSVNISSSSSSDEKKTIARQMDLEKLKNMGERNRMEYYFSYFIDLIENGSYEEAYDMLYPEFRETYFNTLSSFTQYAKKTFPKMANLNHTNIERNGDVYVLWVEISDVLKGSKDDVVELNIVIRENDFADIEMSFSVI